MSRAWLIGSVVLLLGAGFVVESKALTQTPSPTSTTTPTGIVVTGCPGDCDNGGEVTVDEVITSVSIALGDLSLDMCRSVDVDGDGSVSIDELIMAVSAALSGCGSPQGDSFEPDNNPQTARSIACNATQTRSLSPVGDVDWLMVSLPQRMDVVIETSGASSDTILNLFDANLTFLEYNDDGGQHGFSRIHRVCGSNALEDGLYFFNVGSYTGASIPQYQVAVTCQPCNVANPTNSPTPTSTPTPPPPAPDTYEPDDTSSTAPSIGCGEVQRHTISPFDDIDWMRLSLSERTAVRLQTFGEYYLAMSLYDAQGAFLANSTSIDLQCGINALEPGEYFIELNGYSDTPTSYDVSVLCFPCDQSNPTPLPTQTFEPTWTPAPTFTPAPRDAYEPDDSRGSAQPLQCGELQHHSLSPFDDRDWMELTVSQRSAVRIETASDSYSFSATLSDTSGTNLESSFYSSLAVWDRACGVDALDAGTYFVEVNKTFFSDPDIAYEVGVVCFPCGLPNPTVTPTPTPFLTTTPTSTPTSALRDTFEPDNSAAAAKPIQCGEGQQHTLVPIGDVDWLRLTLPQRSEVHIEAVGQSGDYYAQELNLSLLDTTGTVIDELTYAFPAHIDRACGFDALDAGTYRIEVAQPYAFSGGVGYLVTVSCAPCAVPNQTPTATFTATPTWTPSPTPILLQPDVFEPDDDTAAAKAIQCGEGQLRTLAPTGDVDWVKLVLSQRSTVRIDASSRDFAIDAALLAEDGTPLETSNYAFDVRYDRICGTDALEPGTYYIRFNQTFATFEPTFAYDVSVLCAPCELPNPPSTPTPTPQPTWTPESTLTPGMRDPSEPDNVAALAPYIYCGSTQHHSIVPANDVDWLRFTLPERAGVVIQTSDYSTQVSLFDAQPVQIDAGYPQIQRLCDTGALAAGDYFLQVRSFGDVVPDYEVSVICLPCEGSGSTPRPTFTSTITPTPTVTPTPTATRTPRNTPTPCATQPCAAPVCGDGVVGADEDCDDGGTCIGGANAGSVCFAETDCHGDGICVDGARRFAACSDDADCTGGRCVHCVPQGGDGCAANCTTESDVPFTLVPGQFDGLNIARGTSGAAIGSDFLSIPLPLAGSQTLTIGRQLDGKIPFVVKVSSVDYPAIPVSSLACGCIRGAAAKTCGGMFFEADGMTLATDCTPGTTLGDSVCTAAGKAPCAFVHGAGNTMSGEIGCAAEDTIDVDVSQDSGGSGGPCAFPNVCAFHVALNGAGGPGSAVALNTFSLTAVLGNCSGGDPGTYGPDGIFCTADDPTGGLIGITATLPAVTGTATAVVLNANGSDGSAVGPATATGAPFNCAALAQGNATGAGFAQAFTFVRLDTIGDAVIAESLFAQ